MHRWIVFFAVPTIVAVGTFVSCGSPAESAKPVPKSSCDTNTPNVCGVDAGDVCCRASVVPGGSFVVGGGNPDFGFANVPATVSTFSLDTYEVTVARFRAFTEAFGAWQPVDGVGAHPKIPGSGWQVTWPLAADQKSLVAAVGSCPGGTWTSAADVNENLPMTCIDWYELFAFCAWDGGRLPTMVEHYYVAYGGSDLRLFPWSVPSDAGTIDGNFAVFTPEGGAPLVAPSIVGTHPAGASKWGPLDVGGNVEEWVLDKYLPVPLTKTPQACTDCAALDAPITQRVVQGGSFSDDESGLESSYMKGADPKERLPTRGGRCAR